MCVCVYERETEMACQENISRRILQETVRLYKMFWSREVTGSGLYLKTRMAC